MALTTAVVAAAAPSPETLRALISAYFAASDECSEDETLRAFAVAFRCDPSTDRLGDVVSILQQIIRAPPQPPVDARLYRAACALFAALAFIDTKQRAMLTPVACAQVLGRCVTPEILLQVVLNATEARANVILLAVDDTTGRHVIRLFASRIESSGVVDVPPALRTLATRLGIERELQAAATRAAVARYTPETAQENWQELLALLKEDIDPSARPRTDILHALFTGAVGPENTLSAVMGTAGDDRNSRQRWTRVASAHMHVRNHLLRTWMLDQFDAWIEKAVRRHHMHVDTRIASWVVAAVDRDSRPAVQPGEAVWLCCNVLAHCGNVAWNELVRDIYERALSSRYSPKKWRPVVDVLAASSCDDLETLRYLAITAIECSESLVLVRPPLAVMGDKPITEPIDRGWEWARATCRVHFEPRLHVEIPTQSGWWRVMPSSMIEERVARLERAWALQLQARHDAINTKHPVNIVFMLNCERIDFVIHSDKGVQQDVHDARVIDFLVLQAADEDLAEILAGGAADVERVRTAARIRTSTDNVRGRALRSRAQDLAPVSLRDPVHLPT